MGHWAAVRDNIRIQTQTGPARRGYYAARLLATVWLFKTNVAQPIFLVPGYYPPSHFSIFLHIQIKASIPLGLGCTRKTIGFSLTIRLDKCIQTVHYVYGRGYL